MRSTEKKNARIADQLKEAVRKKPYQKPEKVSEEEHVASKVSCGRVHSCGHLVKKD